jgi:DNA-binding transcriptional regulator YiaG
MARENPLPRHLKKITPAMVVQARERAKMTQAEAAATVHLGAVSRWGEYEAGMRSPDPARFELFLLMTDQHPVYRVAKRRPNGS